MNMRAAFHDTLMLAVERRMQGPDTGPLSFPHILYMQRRVDASFSEAKLGRWLGWAQAAVVASGCATLDDMKEINRRHAGTE